MSYYSEIILTTSEGGVDLVESLIYTLIHRAVKFVCVPVVGGCQFTVSEKNRREIEDTINYLNSVKGHEVPQ